LDPAWIADFISMFVALLAARSARRSASITARTSERVAVLQADVATKSAQAQFEAAMNASRVQLISARESYRLDKVNSAYMALLAHVQAWDEWAHNLNRWNYARYKDWAVPEADVLFSTEYREKDNILDPRIPHKQIAEYAEAPTAEPPDIQPPPSQNAQIVAYASSEVTDLLANWRADANNAGTVGKTMIGSGRASTWEEDYPEIVSENKRKFHQIVRELDEARKTLERQVREELKSTFNPGFDSK
jgi:hypothetical protein